MAPGRIASPFSEDRQDGTLITPPGAVIALRQNDRRRAVVSHSFGEADGELSQVARRPFCSPAFSLAGTQGQTALRSGSLVSPPGFVASGRGAVVLIGDTGAGSAAAPA